MTSQNAIRPKLYIWQKEFLFIGESYIPSRDRTIVEDKLVVSIEGKFLINMADGHQISTRSYLMKAGANFDENIVDINHSAVAIYHLPPLTQDYAALKSIMLPVCDGVCYQHPQEDLLISQLLDIRHREMSPDQVYKILRDFIVLPQLRGKVFETFDPRIVEMVNHIRNSVQENLKLDVFAASVNLSTSRLEKLFKQQVGVPITRYRMCYRVFIGITLLALGHSVTESALSAGFASTAHFSKSFSTIHRVPPSLFFLKPPYVQTHISDDLVESIKLLTA